MLLLANMLRKSLILIIFCLFPSDFVRAIPPPDLIFSATQVFFATAGLFLSSILIWWLHLKVWINSTKHKKKYLTLGIIILVALSLFLFTKTPYVQNLYWQTIVDQELLEIWAEYEKIYSAASEINAFNASESVRRPGITWEEFKTLAGNQDYLVLDIRDDYGYEAGHVPGSLHMRFGDLIRGRWLELLPYKNKPIFLICYVGVTGSLVTNFLSQQGFTNLHRPQGGIIMEVKLREKIPFVGTLIAPGVQGQTHLIKEEEITEEELRNLNLIDMRAPGRHSSSIIIKDTTLPIHQQHFREFMTRNEINTFLASLSPDRTYTPLCDSELSCYQGELLYEDLKRRNISVPGVYRIKNF